MFLGNLERRVAWGRVHTCIFHLPAWVPLATDPQADSGKAVDRGLGRLLLGALLT